ncbi:PUL domain-containing protein [Colletotrichum tofieldiae]|nr:PUL domain-containing protein [Colletotrichum tofieldiae]
MPDAVLSSPMGRMLMPQLNQTINSSRQNGSILGIQNTPSANGYGSASQPTKSQVKVRVVHSSQELDSALEAARKSCAVILFTSATCPPCRVISPVFDELSAEAGDKAAFIKVDVAQLTPLSGKNYPAQLRLSSRICTGRRRMILFSKVPPLAKLLGKMGTTADEPAVQGIKQFVEARDKQGAAAAILPNLGEVSAFIQKSIQSLPAEIVFTVVDLVRCGLVDARFSGYFAEEPEHKTVLAILNFVNSHSECPYALRLVTLQMACNFFSTPLFPEEILRNEALRAPVIQLISSSFLDDSHNNVRVSASSLMFNLALFSNKARREKSGDVLPEGDTVELAASVLEAIGQEESSPEALQGMLLALGNLVYCAPADSEVSDLLRAMDAEDTILAKKKQFPNEKLIEEVGSELLGKGLRRP